MRRIVAALHWQRPAERSLLDIADLAREMQAELLALFIEDLDLLHLAALPFAAQIGAASATRHALDAAALEQLMRARAAELRSALEQASGGTLRWSFRIARGSPARLLAAAGAEDAPTLLLPAGADIAAAAHPIVLGELTEALLAPLLARRQPVLVRPGAAGGAARRATGR